MIALTLSSALLTFFAPSLQQPRSPSVEQPRSLRTRVPAPSLLFDWLRTVGPDFEAEDLSPEATAAVNDICSDNGWDLRCEIGSLVAKGLGGSGELASGPETSTATLDICVQFSLDEGYTPPQGPTRLRRSSRYFDEIGFWKVDADTDDGVPQRARHGDRVHRNPIQPEPRICMKAVPVCQ